MFDKLSEDINNNFALLPLPVFSYQQLSTLLPPRENLILSTFSR